MSHAADLRKRLVRIAGMVGPYRILAALKVGVMEQNYAQFADHMSRYLWGVGSASPVKYVQVSVPRSLRRILGRSIRVRWASGHKVKNRRRHNRRWVPEPECDCE